jgi:hypothetical protein
VNVSVGTVVPPVAETVNVGVKVLVTMPVLWVEVGVKVFVTMPVLWVKVGVKVPVTNSVVPVTSGVKVGVPETAIVGVFSAGAVGEPLHPKNKVKRTKHAEIPEKILFFMVPPGFYMNYYILLLIFRQIKCNIVSFFWCLPAFKQASIQRLYAFRPAWLSEHILTLVRARR